jgi:hypothetical protein
VLEVGVAAVADGGYSSDTYCHGRLEAVADDDDDDDAVAVAVAVVVERASRV